MKTLSSIHAFAAVPVLLAPIAPAAIVIPTVAIGDAGNAPDLLTGNGSVAYPYRLGKTEVTNVQYAAFLNAKAASDPHELYNRDMNPSFGGITRSGPDGAYRYSVVSGREHFPIAHVSFWDAVRFTNWLHNGQGSGDTENGAYTLTEQGIHDNTVTRNAGARWAIPSVDEWYKAAYSQPANQGGPLSNYWLYPVSSNTVNTTQANFNTVLGHTAQVGSYSLNYRGLFDMGGNVEEMTENIRTSLRVTRGGNFYSRADSLSSASSSVINNGVESGLIGFRVVQVPGPTPVALLAMSGLVAMMRRRTSVR